MNRDCYGHVFKRWGRKWGRCFRDSTLFEITGDIPDTCPNCDRLFFPEAYLHAETSAAVKSEIDVPFYRQIIERYRDIHDGNKRTLTGDDSVICGCELCREVRNL